MTKEAFGELYLQLLPGLFRLAQSILRHREDAMDAVQQAIEKAWKASGRMRPGEEKAYIARIVINECRNIQRYRMRMTTCTDFDFPERKQEEPDRELYEAVANLPEKYRTPLLLRYMEGYSEKEAAEALKISTGALKSRLFRARNQLRNMIIEEREKE